MSTVQTSAEEPDSQKVTDPGTIKWCRSCWREDVHFVVKCSPWMYGFLLVLTFGLVLFIRPSQCCCCGEIRVF